MNEQPSPLDSKLVFEFVSAGHGDLAKVKAMLREEPALINASWDWGGGDWESALGGAAHMGSREVAEYLLANGARFDIYAAAMLGKLKAVRTALEAFPAARHAPGAHGISLREHAVFGGEPAAAVVAYLDALDRPAGGIDAG